MECLPAVLGIEARQRDSQGGAGSGFLVTPDGYALTNSHVVHGRDKLAATTSDGDRLDADLIGDDPSTDLALLRLAARDLPVAELGDSETLRVGQLRHRHGRPTGVSLDSIDRSDQRAGTEHAGTGGAADREHRSALCASESRGIQGALWSIHTVASSESITAIIALAQGLGFAIPANTAKWVIGELISHGRVRTSLSRHYRHRFADPPPADSRARPAE